MGGPFLDFTHPKMCLLLWYYFAVWIRASTTCCWVTFFRWSISFHNCSLVCFPSYSPPISSLPHLLFSLFSTGVRQWLHDKNREEVPVWRPEWPQRPVGGCTWPGGPSETSKYSTNFYRSHFTHVQVGRVANIIKVAVKSKNCLCNKVLIHSYYVINMSVLVQTTFPEKLWLFSKVQ